MLAGSAALRQSTLGIDPASLSRTASRRCWGVPVAVMVLAGVGRERA
jgi:hypothetical protein